MWGWFCRNVKSKEGDNRLKNNGLNAQNYKCNSYHQEVENLLKDVEKNSSKKLSTLSTGVFIIVFYLIIKKV